MKNIDRVGRIPVSTVRTGCVPFNRSQKSEKGYKVGENPVKSNGNYVLSFDSALEELRAFDRAGWRDYGGGNSQSAQKAIGWVTASDAKRLLIESDNEKRVDLFRSLADVVE